MKYFNHTENFREQHSNHPCAQFYQTLIVCWTHMDLVLVFPFKRQFYYICASLTLYCLLGYFKVFRKRNHVVCSLLELTFFNNMVLPRVNHIVVCSCRSLVLSALQCFIVMYSRISLSIWNGSRFFLPRIVLL